MRRTIQLKMELKDKIISVLSIIVTGGGGKRVAHFKEGKRTCSCRINAPGEQAVVFINPLQRLPGIKSNRS